jgi:hypothetical protein
VAELLLRTQCSCQSMHMHCTVTSHLNMQVWLLLLQALEAASSRAGGCRALAITVLLPGPADLQGPFWHTAWRV